MEKQNTGPDPSCQADKNEPLTNVGIPQFACNEDAAHWWLDFGFTPIPALPGSKHAALKWDPWLGSLSHESIAQHWAKHPDHEVGIIPGNKVIVLDSDTPQSLAAQRELQQQFGVTPTLIIETSRGVHDYLQLADGTFAKSDSHDSAANPAGIDIKTGRGFVMIAPSTGKVVVVCDAVSADDLTMVGQDFIDAIARHNGRQPPRPPEAVPRLRAIEHVSDASLKQLSALVGVLDPDRDYDSWVQGGMAIFYETGGSADGLAMFDLWSSRGRKYKGFREIADKWKSFSLDQPNPVTIRTLRQRVDAAGHDWIAVCAALEPQFEVCAYEVISLPVEATVTEAPATRLDRYSLRGRSDELERLALETVHVLGQLVLLGEATVIYAAPNSGKTLLVLHLLIEAIQAGRIDAAKLYFLNMDDSHRGLLQKVRIAEEYGFHLLAEGHRDFSADDFRGEIETMIAEGQAHGVIIVLDTLKKFVNVMDKVQGAKFAQLIRRFIMQGGTVIVLSHTNKNPGPNGKPRPGGTSDILDDFDCGWTISVATPRDDAGFKVVEFHNEKNRGFVAETAAFRYDATRHDSYLELLLSVEEVDPMQVVTLRQAEQIRTDAEMVDAITACIRDGTNTRMKLAKAVMQRVGASRRRVLEIVDRYTGSDLGRCRWRYSSGPRGAWVYELLDDSAPAEPDDDDEVPDVDA